MIEKGSISLILRLCADDKSTYSYSDFVTDKNNRNEMNEWTMFYATFFALWRLNWAGDNLG